ncbi:G2/mitotic-specific cyclin-1 [Bienertia sinuspersici]
MPKTLYLTIDLIDRYLSTKVASRKELQLIGISSMLFIKATVSSDKEMEYMAFYLAKNGLMHYQLVVSFCPSLIAAAAVYVALTYLGRTPIWTEILEHYRGYSEEQLKECTKMLIKYQMAAKDTKLKGVHLQVFEHRQGCSCAQFGSKK